MLKYVLLFFMSAPAFAATLDCKITSDNAVIGMTCSNFELTNGCTSMMLDKNSGNEWLLSFEPNPDFADGIWFTYGKNGNTARVGIFTGGDYQFFYPDTNEKFVINCSLN